MENKFQDWFVNVAASLILVLLWKGAAWLFAYWHFTSQTEDEWFMMFVAVSLALNIPGRRASDSAGEKHGS